MNPTLDAQVSRRLTRYYILALTAVALLTLAGQAVIQYSLGDVLDDARVINIAGRQRMLSQQLTKRAILLSRPDIYPPGTNAYARDFDALLNLWKTNPCTYASARPPPRCFGNSTRTSRPCSAGFIASP